MSPLDEAFHDWADSHEAGSPYDAFVGGWEARAAQAVEQLREARDQLMCFWKLRLASAEAERDAALMKLSSCQYERTAFKRHRDDLAKALVEAKQP